MSGSLNRGGEKNIPSIPDASATRNFTHLARGPWLYHDEMEHTVYTLLCFAVVWSPPFPCVLWVNSLTLGRSYDSPNSSELILKNETKQNKIVCIFVGNTINFTVGVKSRLFDRNACT